MTPAKPQLNMDECCNKSMPSVQTNPNHGSGHYVRASSCWTEMSNHGRFWSGITLISYHTNQGGGPRVVVSTAAFHARVRGSVPGLGGLKETKMFLPHPRVKLSTVGSLRDREVACSASDCRARISNPVSGGQCHPNHLTILRRFSWPSLAYMCTKVA